jgi:hypothetical protein
MCNPASGACEATVNACDDGVDCTIDVCDPSTGCKHTPNDAVCDLQDKCNTYKCDAKLDCQATEVTCTEDGLFCTTTQCVLYQGCNNQPYSCNNSDNDNSDTNCSTVECSEGEAKCVLTEHECAILDEPIVITVAALSGGIIAGIVVAIIAFLALSGGGAYAISQRMGMAGNDAVVNNPLYKSQGNTGANPLFKNS